MNLMIKEHSWECLSYSFAMVLGTTPYKLYDIIGHDGSQIVWPHLPEPMCRRGFHIQEMIGVALELGQTVTPVEMFPLLKPTPIGSDHDHDSAAGWPSCMSTQDQISRFHGLISIHTGVLEGECKLCHHAVAFNKGQVYDPDGKSYIYSLSNCQSRGFYGRTAYLVL